MLASKQDQKNLLARQHDLLMQKLSTYWVESQYEWVGTVISPLWGPMIVPPTITDDQPKLMEVWD